MASGAVNLTWKKVATVTLIGVLLVGGAGAFEYSKVNSPTSPIPNVAVGQSDSQDNSTSPISEVQQYTQALSAGNRAKVNKMLGGVAKTNFDRFKNVSKMDIQLQILSSNTSGPIATVEAQLTAGDNIQEQLFTLFRQSTVWKIIDIQYEPWRLYKATPGHGKIQDQAKLVIQNFITESATGNLSSALTLLTGNAYNQTEPYVQGHITQPEVQVGPLHFGDSSCWTANNCGVSVTYTTHFSKHIFHHDEWFSLVDIGGAWKIEEVLSI